MILVQKWSRKGSEAAGKNRPASEQTARDGEDSAHLMTWSRIGILSGTADFVCRLAGRV